MRLLILKKYVWVLIFCVNIEPSFAISGWYAECFHTAVPHDTFRKPIQPGTDRFSAQNMSDRNTVDISTKDKTTRVFIPATSYLSSQPGVLTDNSLNPICWLACNKRETMLIKNLSNTEKAIISHYTTIVTQCTPQDDDDIKKGYTTIRITDSEWDASADFLNLFLSHAHTAFAQNFALTLWQAKQHGLIEWVNVQGHATFRLSQKGQTNFEKAIDTGSTPYPQALQFRDLLQELKPELFTMTSAESRFIHNLREVAPAVISVIEFNPVTLAALLSLSSSPNPPYVIAKDPAMLFAYHQGIQKDVFENIASDYRQARDSIWNTIYALKAMISIDDSE